MDKFTNVDNIKNVQFHYEKKLFKLRKEANKLCFNHHFSKSMIARKKKVSRDFVRKWTQSPQQDFTKDNRGWKKGKRRKWTKETEKRIKKIHRDHLQTHFLRVFDLANNSLR